MHQRDNTTKQKEETLHQAKERKHEAVIGHYEKSTVFRTIC